MLNWLALAGWGARHDESTSSSGDAPDSTAVFNLPELIKEVSTLLYNFEPSDNTGQFDLTSVTHRNTSLDQLKLAYLNKQHLLRERSTPEGLTRMAERGHGLVKDAFPESPYTSVEGIEKAIVLLEVRSMPPEAQLVLIYRAGPFDESQGTPDTWVLPL